MATTLDELNTIITDLTEEHGTDILELKIHRELFEEFLEIDLYVSDYLGHKVLILDIP